MKRREFVKVMGALSVASPTPPRRGAINDAKGVPRRSLGSTGVDVSVLALGGVIGMQLPPSRDHDPSGLAEQCLNLGITYFDTAPSYNNGQSETNYGPVIAHRRGELFLATKTGDRSYDGTRRSIEQSLRRLTDRPRGSAPDPRRVGPGRPGSLGKTGWRRLGAAEAAGREGRPLSGCDRARHRQGAADGHRDV